jgi:hypothetical protein
MTNAEQMVSEETAEKDDQHSLVDETAEGVHTELDLFDLSIEESVKDDEFDGQHLLFEETAEGVHTEIQPFDLTIESMKDDEVYGVGITVQQFGAMLDTSKRAQIVRAFQSAKRKAVRCRGRLNSFRKMIVRGLRIPMCCSSHTNYIVPNT